jgi:hypothetical protein
LILGVLLGVLLADALAHSVVWIVFMFVSFGCMGGTAYAGYEMIRTPGYYVHQWNLYNADLVRPLYVGLSWPRAPWPFLY